MIRTSSGFRDISSLVSYLLTNFLNPLLILLAGLALLAFFKGLAQFIYSANNPKSHQDGINLMKWGLVALFVMVSILGILRFMYNDAGFGGMRQFGIPLLPQGSSGTR